MIAGMRLDTDQGPLVFADDVGRVKVTVDALVKMLAHRQVEETAAEAGGILVGRHIVDCEDVVVDWVTEPLPTDRRSRFRFHRSEAHFEAVHRAWDESGGRVDYLGEWHTHAEPDPTPSGIDRADWGQALRLQAHAESLVFVIVGLERVRAWRVRWRGADLVIRPLEATVTPA